MRLGTGVRLYARYALLVIVSTLSVRPCVHSQGRRLDESVQTVSFSISSIDRGSIEKIVCNSINRDAQITDLTFSSDVVLSESEFRYLFDIKEGKTLSCSQLAVGIERLFKKEKFDAIVCTPTEDCAEGVSVHLDLKGIWTFGNLRFKGIMVGRERLRQYYMMESGEPFDISKHEHSLKKMRTVLRNDGYVQASLHCTLDRDEQTKTVYGNVKIERGDCFRVSHAHVVIRSNEFLDDAASQQLAAKLRKRYVAHMVGGYYSKYLLDKEASALRDYLARHGYPSVRIQLDEHSNIKKKKVGLVFTVELCEKRVFNFIGNDFFSRDELLDTILCFGNSSWLLPISIIAQEIERAYHAKGFWSVMVTAIEEQRACTFTIIEGARVRLTDIVLKGIEAYESTVIKKQFFDGSLYAHYYDAQAIAHAIDQLCSYYYKDGFWQMKVLEQRQAVDEDTGEYFLVITVDEGVQTYINTITVIGVEALKELPFDTKERIACSEMVLQKQKEWLIAECKRLRLDVVRMYPEYTRYANGVDLTWNVELADREDTVGKMVVVGSSRFPFECIVRETGNAEGTTWNPALLQHSLKRIKQLGIFEQVSLRPCSYTERNNERDIIAYLHLDDPYEARIRLGAGLINTGKQYRFEDLTYKAGGSLLFKNITNCADQIKCEADVTRTHRVLEIGYWRPWILDMPVETLVQAYDNRFEYPGLLRGLVDLYCVSQQGILLGLTRKETYGMMSCNVGIEWMETILPDERPCLFDTTIAEAINFEPNLVGKKVPYLWCEPTFYLEWLDNKMNPSRGFSTLASMKAMVPVSKTKIASYFVKIMAEQCVYVPFDPLVLALRVRGGYIFHQCFKNVMPTERFYLGGVHSIRSYDTDLCPPLGKITDTCTGNEQFVPQGGKAMINGSCELRFPVYENLGGVLFQDIGYLSGSGLTDLLHSELLLATGIGVRYNTPISPLRFDIGFKWSKPDPSLSRYAWFLSFGQPF